MLNTLTNQFGDQQEHRSHSTPQGGDGYSLDGGTGGAGTRRRVWPHRGGRGEEDGWGSPERWVGRRIRFRHNTVDPDDHHDVRFDGWPAQGPGIALRPFWTLGVAALMRD
ncbi:hypothetical protein AFA91_02170 [Mycolicibacterium goodii]|uniref:Uncharacterized protein n=1 Tax=Mycolicibacterium goodii TaxID=134601 RepID=A0A0K0X0P8_MYCGD|nr:hypothetical protein AFA91_02170 [Mycolicibacterium goodii]